MSIKCHHVTPYQKANTLSDIAIVIPIYNEALHLSNLLNTLIALNPALIVLVDDASTDHSSDICAEFERSNSNIKTLLHKQNLGKQAAIRSGLRLLMNQQIAYNSVALLDGDGQHDPFDLLSLIPLLEEYDVVIGARKQTQMPLIRKLSNALVNMSYYLIGGVDFVDVQSGLRLYRKQAANYLAKELRADGRYALEHESLAILAQSATNAGITINIAATSISCSYGAASSIRKRDVAALALMTIRHALAVRGALQ